MRRWVIAIGLMLCVLVGLVVGLRVLQQQGFIVPMFGGFHDRPLNGLSLPAIGDSALAVNEP
jgi:hypothetical protein